MPPRPRMAVGQSGILDGGWIRELIAWRDLLYMLTLREIKVKYKQSVMGLLWAILMPALIVSAGVLVKVAFAKLSETPIQARDMVDVSVRALPWAFFVASIRFGSVSLIANGNLVTKIYMPREVFPLSAVLSQLFDLAVASTVLIAMLVFLKVGMSVQLLWVPVLLAMLIILATAAGIILSAASLFLRDVKYLVEVFVTFAIFFTPVFYDVSMFGHWSTLLLLNPVAPILEGFSSTIVDQRVPELGWLLYTGVFAVSSLVAALALFKRMEPYFAESV